MGSTYPWASSDFRSTVSILAPQELHFCTETVIQILLEPLSILTWPESCPGTMRLMAVTLVQAVLVWCWMCHQFGACRAGLVLDVPLV